MKSLKNLVYVTVMSLVVILHGCGGGGGGDSGPGGESTAAPYLLSKPAISYSADGYGGYYITVSLEADGPFGVTYADVWVEDVYDDYNSDSIELINVGGTTWVGTSYLSMPPSTYRVFDVELLDSADWVPGFGADFRMGWYFYSPQLSAGRYVVDQRHIYNNPEFNMVGFGVSSIPVALATTP